MPSLYSHSNLKNTYVDICRNGQYNVKRVKKENVLCCTVQKGDQFLCKISFRFSVHIVYLFYMVMGCIIIQEVKGLTEKLYSSGGRPISMQNQVHCSHRMPVFTCIII